MSDRITPIEMMIDKACGVPKGTRFAPRIPTDAEITCEASALLEIAEAAKRWAHNHKKGTARLRKAVASWVKIGD